MTANDISPVDAVYRPRPASPMLLLGIGGAGCTLARSVNRAFGGSVRYALADTDAASGDGDGAFTLLGGDRLSGRGAGGDIVAARMATQDSSELLDAQLEGVRLAVIVTALGGGTGGGATLETVKHLSARGIPSVVFATTPFVFEGEDRQRSARGIMAMIEDAANASFFLPLDKLVQGEDNMEDALKRGLDTLASGVTLFWRLVEKPGYIRLDTERIRHLIANAGHGRFATVTMTGEDRAEKTVAALVQAPLLKDGSSRPRAILCGVLAGDDLRLSEIGKISEGLRTAYGADATFDLATVNDEETFSGRLVTVAMIFERGGAEPEGASTPKTRRGHGAKPSVQPVAGRGRFNNAERTEWHGEDLDTPTFVRQNITLEY